MLDNTRPLIASLRAIPLVAALGIFSTACMHPTLASGVSRSSSVAFTSVASQMDRQPDGAPPKVVIRDYWRAPSASVVGWSPDEDWQGLRSAIRRDGTLVHDHILYLSTYSIPDLRAFGRAQWHAFAEGSDKGVNLQFYGVARDVLNCKGKKGCTPYMFMSVRMPDKFLRESRDGITVKALAQNGEETSLSLSPELIGSYLATVDSLSASRRKPAVASRN